MFEKNYQKQSCDFSSKINYPQRVLLQKMFHEVKHVSPTKKHNYLQTKDKSAEYTTI